MTSDRKANANRKNATKSTGPKTVNGKNAVRRNALRHGLAAQVLVVEGEDREGFRAMADGHRAAFRPRNEVELELVNTFTISAWTRMRCVSTLTGMINQHIRETQIAEELCLKDRVFELGRRLFFDSQERWPLYPDPSVEDFPVFKRKSDPFSGHEPPARLVNELETTYLGCCWLLERWNELRVLTLPGNTWRAFDKFKAIRLLGKQPLDVLDDPSGDLAVIFLATHAICPMSKYAFSALRCEVESLQFAVIRKRLEDRRVERFAPADEDAARQLLNNLISREIGRLEQLALERRNESDAEAAERLSRLAFDPSDVADKVRRYEDAAIRRMSRSCMDFIKVRQNGIFSEDADDEPGLVKAAGAHDDEHDGTAGETVLHAPTPVPEMTENSSPAAANGGPAAAGDTPMNETEAPHPAADLSARAQPSETKVNGPRFTLHASGGTMLGLLFLALLAWLMASAQGAVRRASAMTSGFGASTERDEAPLAPSTCTEPNSSPKRQRAASQKIPLRWPGPSLTHAADIATTASDRARQNSAVRARVPSQARRALIAGTAPYRAMRESERQEPPRRPPAQNKAKVIYAGCAGPAHQHNLALGCCKVSPGRLNSTHRAWLVLLRRGSRGVSPR